MTFLDVLIAAVQAIERGEIDYGLADCPDEVCCGLHEPVNNRPLFTCPLMQREWVECVDCGWADADPEPTVINDELRCHECASEYAMCAECRRWRRAEDMHTECDYPEGLHWCDRCWDGRGGCECCHNDYDDDDDDGEEEPHGEAARRCSTCSSSNRHMDLLTEKFVCDHTAQELLVHFVPVKLAAPLPEATTIPSDCEWVDVIDAAWDEVLSSESS